MVHHFKHLLVDMPMKQSLARIEKDSEKRRQQFQKYLNYDIFHFYLLAR